MYIRDFTYRRFLEGREPTRGRKIRLKQTQHSCFPPQPQAALRKQDCRVPDGQRSLDGDWKHPGYEVYSLLPREGTKPQTLFDHHQTLCSLPRSDCDLSLLQHQMHNVFLKCSLSDSMEEVGMEQRTLKNTFSKKPASKAQPLGLPRTVGNIGKVCFHMNSIVNLLALREHLCVYGISLSSGDAEAGEWQGVWGSSGLPSEF